MARAKLMDAELTSRARGLYESGGAPIQAVADLLGIHRRTLQKRASALGWRRSLATPNGNQTQLEENVPVGRRAMVARIRRTVEREISTVEDSLARIDELVPRGDAEKAARTLASLVKTLIELQRLEAGAGADTAKDPDEDGIDIDEFRRDLARRLDALRASGDRR
jgi:hypothetical protein